ncbi:hypothetical protein [Gracilibacillus massiliensis]|uniref:hypothetical protein n=1 Tax=Gracilibacillus massiliensis TaxID=1564956 RepID=UPI00071D5145|nr:hypothetical protein [Gracilibacillus massiliensis]
MSLDLADKAANSKVAETIAKQLWLSMLFLVVMSLIVLFGAKWWSSSLESQFLVYSSYLLWFIAMMVITGFKVFILFIDAKMQFESNKNT